MRTRTAKKLAQRIELNYFKRPHGMRRLRFMLSLAIPALGLLWLGGMAAAGSRAPYSSGPVSSAHAFAENKCEVCHQRDDSFRAHVGDKACLTCHAGPAHVPPAAAAAHQEPSCASCHREHQGRVALASAVSDSDCVSCHGDLKIAGNVVKNVHAFPARHAEFAILRDGRKDPGTLRFNHQVHANDNLRGPDGPEKLECAGCHRPQLSPTRAAAKRVANMMTSVTYNQQCARCHPLFFDERVDATVPHGDLQGVRPFIEKSLREFIAANPSAISERDFRRLPLNFPQEPEPVARNAEEWVAKRAPRAQRTIDRACAYCHGTSVAKPNIQKTWMPRAAFDHAPHLMVQCTSCHDAEKSRETADVLMPSVQACATCHAPSKGASAQCIECHGYHDWSKAQPVKPHFKLTDFQ